MLKKEDYRQYLLTTYAAWLGKNIGIRLGAPVEGWTSQKIEDTYHGKLGYLCDYDIFAADDDSNGPAFFVRALLNKKDITAQDVGNTFLAYLQEYSGFFWWGGVGVSTEHTAYENLKNGIPAGQSGSIAQNGIAIAEQIGGQIFSDCWGYVSGYDPNLAKDLAIKASSVTHDGNGIQGGIFVAVAICLAYKMKDAKQIIKEALKYLNPEMEYSQKVNLIMDFYQKHPNDWHECLKYIQDNYGYDKYPGVCHIIPNLCIMIMGMCYGENDFSKTLTIINQSGWDTDCNCGNVGSIMGAMVGVDGIDPSWITPINDVLNASSCIGYLNIQTISQSSKLFAQLAFKLRGIDVMDEDHFDLPYAAEGIRCKDSIEVKNNCLSISSKSPVYGYAYYLGKDIYDSRYDPSFSPLLYPNDTITFELEEQSENIVRIFVQDCQGNKEYSQDYKANGMISYTIKPGLNKTINKYGLELIAGTGEYQIKKIQFQHNSNINLDFRNYPIDEYGPRYGGDTLYNLRGIVTHSGKWKVNEDGLIIQCDDHCLLSTGVPMLVHSVSMEFSGNNMLTVFGMKDALNYQAVGIQNKELVYLEKKEGKLFVNKLLKINEYKDKYTFNLNFFNDRINVVFNGRVFVVPETAEKGIVGLASEKASETTVYYLQIA